MTRQLVDDTMNYVRKELTRIAHESNWADGIEAQRLNVRRMRLVAELERLGMLRQSIQQDIDAAERA
jgi:hypothetical protein